MLTGDTDAAGSPVRIGMLRLSDSAPLVVAQATGLFAAHGVAVDVVVLDSWDELADDLTAGRLDAALMVPTLVLAHALGLAGPATPLIVPLSLSSGGNAITFSLRVAAALRQGCEGSAAPTLDPLALGLGLRRMIDRALAQGMPERPTLAVVHPFSSHNLLLRYWLSGCGIDPDSDVSIVILPPQEMAAALARGDIDGFCAGAPWGAVATRDGVGEIMLFSSQIWQRHPEKCLTLRHDWAERDPRRTQALIQALLQACRTCDDPTASPAIAALLAQPAYIGVDAEQIMASLPGGDGHGLTKMDLSSFTHTRPTRAIATWMLHQMSRWYALPPEAEQAACASEVYRPDLHDSAVRALGWPPVPDFSIRDTNFFDQGRSQA